jgi:hypothetical protein
LLERLSSRSAGHNLIKTLLFLTEAVASVKKKPSGSAKFPGDRRTRCLHGQRFNVLFSGGTAFCDDLDVSRAFTKKCIPFPFVNLFDRS